VVDGAMKRLARLIDPSGPPSRVTLEALSGVLAVLLSRPSGAVAGKQDIEFDRVPMVRVGGIILGEILRASGLLECTISPFGIREGAILNAARSARWQGAPSTAQEDSRYVQPAEAGGRA
jgi:exopolyphosphatase/pppGpp-phosphohydrolase